MSKARLDILFRFGLALGLGALAACGGSSSDALSDTGVATTTPTSKPTTATTAGSDSSVLETSAPTVADEPGVDLDQPEPNIASGSFGTGQAFSILSALGQIPMANGLPEDAKIEIYVADLLAASDASGQQRPTGSTDFGEVADWLNSITGSADSVVLAPVPFDMQNSAAELLEYKEEIGFSITDVDAVIELGPLPNSLTILAGDLEHASTSEVADGVFSFGEGEDFTVNIEERTPARQLGRPLRVAAQSDLVLLSRSTGAVAGWLDQEVPRLDSVPELVLVAKALDQQGVLGAALFQSNFSADGLLENLDPAVAEALIVPISEPFDTIGLGWGVVDGEGALTIVYGFVEETAANAMAPIIESMFLDGESLASGRSLSDLLVLDHVEVQNQVVVVSLRVPPDSTSRITLSMVLSRDLPFLFQLGGN